ncbi:MAG: hydrogenase formation protein HypD [Lachnospiraceae bacterium]|nr:hydrogenase formation protein HypD [Lachnospiraceae bacterium]
MSGASGSAGNAVSRAADYLKHYDGPEVRIMEVCGTHTHEIFRLGIRRMLSEKIRLISGPGCPVCVTPAGFIDEAVYLADKNCVICTFGDLVRVPGNHGSLQRAREKGAQIRVVYSPQDAERYAEEHPDQEVVFLSVGFETTTPSECIAVRDAKRKGLKNFSLLTANKTMPSAYRAMSDAADVYLYPGHVHAMIGTKLCEALTEEGISGVCAGFTGKELVTALAAAVTSFEKGEPFFLNAYPRVVRQEGSPAAIRLVDEIMEPCDAFWRGLGVIPESGMRLREAYADYDARKKYDIPVMKGNGNPACRCGDVLRGSIEPHMCPMFGRGCTPEHPVGACMVSSEGACSAWYQYGDTGMIR